MPLAGWTDQRRMNSVGLHPIWCGHPPASMVVTVRDAWGAQHLPSPTTALVVPAVSPGQPQSATAVTEVTVRMPVLGSVAVRGFVGPSLPVANTPAP